MLGIVITICITILMIIAMYFNHKERMAKNNPINNLFKSNNDKERKNGKFSEKN